MNKNITSFDKLPGLVKIAIVLIYLFIWIIAWAFFPRAILEKIDSYFEWIEEQD